MPFAPQFDIKSDTEATFFAATEDHSERDRQLFYKSLFDS